MSLSLEQFLERLSASSLMSTVDVESLVEGLPSQDKPQDGEQLARILVQQQKLTAFQAQQIYGGNQNSLVLGNYIVLDKLGQGGMGMVLKAEHRRMHRLVALKILSPVATKTPGAVKRFHREVEAAAKLEHPNIVTAYDADESGGTHFLVMQYVEGKDLSVLVKKKGPLAVDKAVHCVLQAARGLQYAHEQGVIHRDIKPANLLVDAKGTVQILDMGLARLENTGGNPDQAELTSTGQIMGTVDYMAPEQALSTKDADARSDIYSLGITLWYLLTGRAAYDGDNLTAKLLAHQQSPIPSLTAACSGTSAALDSLFKKMVAKDRNDRHQSMAEVVTDLERCLAPSASAPTITATSSEDSKFHAFLENLDADKSQATIASPGKKQVTADSQPDTEHAATISYDSSTEDTNPQVDVPFDAATNAASKTAQTSALPINLHDRRVQIGGASAALLIVAGLIWGLTGNRGLETPTEETTNSPNKVPPVAVAPFDETQAATHQTAWADHLNLPKEKNVKLPGGATMAFVLIPPGEFTMGSTDDGSQSENATRRVKISEPFYLAKHEMTQAEWSAVMGTNPSHFKGDLSLPVESVRWEDSQPLLKKLNDGMTNSGLTCVLPTEAQWEYACRAGTTGRWHFGDNEALLSEYGVFKNNSVGGTHAVGSRKPNPWGLYDMYGNVWEWCADWYLEFESKPNVLRDPVGPASGERRVNRGGSWSAHAYSCRSAYRAHNPPTEAYEGIGFRLALTIESPSSTNDASPGVPKSTPLKSPPLAAAPFDAHEARRHQQAWAEYLDVPDEFTNELGMTFRLIPPGEFTMGLSPQEVAKWRQEIERAIAESDTGLSKQVSTIYTELLAVATPARRVKIDRPFYLGVHEVTQQQYTAVVGTNPSLFQGEEPRIAGLDTSRHPVDKASWHDAVNFCKKLEQRDDLAQRLSVKVACRLPNEAEWEYACKAGTTTKYWTGDDEEGLREAAWFGDAKGRTHPVGELQPNPFGLFDIHGNVFEWCEDRYLPPNNRDPIAAGSTEAETLRVFRGGNWRSHASMCRSALPNRYEGAGRLSITGFRVALTIESPKLKPRAQPVDLPPKHNYAISFNGKTSHVDLPTLKYDASHPLTIEAWVESTGNNLNPRIINNDGRTAAGPNGGLIVQLSKTGHVGFLLQGEKNVRGETELPPGRHHVALVCDQAEARFYLDGKKAITRPGKYADIKHSLASFRIGTHSNGLSEVHRFKGTVDEVRFSSTARYTDDFTPQQRFETDETTLALYHCDEGQGEVLNDSSLHNHHGKVVDAIWTTQDGKPVASPSQLALQFDGAGYVNIPSLKIASPPQLTIEAIVKADAPHQGMIVSNAGRAGFGFKISNDRWQFDGYGMAAKFAIVANQPTSFDQWTHVAAVIDGTQVRLFVDGQLQQQTATIDLLKPSASQVAIGANPEANGIRSPFRGAIRFVRISETARYKTSFKVPASFDADGNTLVTYRFDEGHGTRLNDSSGNNHHGKIANAQWVTAESRPFPSRTSRALAFNGKDSYVEIPTLNDAFNSPVTLEAWVTVENRPQGVPLALEVGGLKLRLFQTGRGQWMFLAYGTEKTELISMPEPAKTGTPTHVAGVYDDKQIRLYIDGKIQSRWPIPPGFQLKPEQTHGFIGGKREKPKEAFLGKFHGVRISKVARYTKDFTPEKGFTSDNNTIALYQFDEGRGTDLRDSSGNNHHGQIFGAKWVKASTPAADPEPAIDHDRNTARGVLQAGGYVTLQLDEAAGTTQVKQLDALPTENFTLRSIYLSNVKDIGNDQLFHLSKLRGLHELHLHNTNVTDVGLQYLRSITTLRNINLYGTQVTDAGLQHLAALPKLHSVSLSSTPAESTGLAGLRSLKTLRSVLVSEQITKARVIELSSIPQLRQLRIAGDPPQITSAVVAEFHKQNPHCRIRKLKGPVIGRDPVRELAEWVQQQGGRLTLGDLKSVSGYQDFTANQKLPEEAFRIRMIDLNRSENIVDADLARFTASTFLHELKLGNTKIGDEGVAHLANCTTLASIWLDQTQITNRSLETLSRLPNLAHYYLHTTQISAKGLQALLRNPQIQGLSLGGKHITGEALGPISQMTDLRSLSLWSSDIGDADIQQLSKLHKLEKLDVSGTRVTRAAAEQLSKALPHCIISYGPGNAKMTIEPVTGTNPATETKSSP